MSTPKSADSLKQVVLEVGSCTLCALSLSRTKSVPGSGDFSAQIVFVGEGPGRNEDLSGEPFVGTAGKLLDKLLESVSILRSDVFITNIVKCRPPSNRDPLPEEVSLCSNYLKRQIGLIKPKVVATLGRYALNYFFPESSIGQVHGKILSYENINLLPLYHPAAALRSNKLRETLFLDFKNLPYALRESIRKKSPST